MKETRVYELSDRTVHDVCVKLKKPYFGPHLYARQGDPRRHLYMQAVVDSQAKLAGAQPLNILEVGSWAGGSAITWALALRAFHKPAGKVVCVDPWRPYLDLKALGPAPVYNVMSDAAASGEIYELFQHNLRSAAVDDIVMPFRGDSDSTLPLLADNAFDIVFIDGAHDYGSVAKDMRNTARLVREGGILCGDDLEAQYGCVDADFNRANSMKDFVEDPKTRTWYHPGVSRAVGEFFGPVSCWEGFWAMRRVRDGWIPIELPSADLYPLPPHLTDSLLGLTVLFIEGAKSRGFV